MTHPQQDSNRDRNLLLASHDGRRYLYVIRRAFCLGLVRRQDVCSAFGLSSAQAGRVMETVKTLFPELVRAVPGGRGIEPRPGAETPSIASWATVLSLLGRGEDASVCGISPDECGLHQSEPQPCLMDPRDLATLMSSWRTKQVIDVRYVGMKRNESARWRSVIVMGLELHLGQQWRAVVFDVEKEVERTFVMSRISGARAAAHPAISRRLGLWRKKANRLVGGDKEIYEVKLNPALSEDQRVCVRKEFGLGSGNTAHISIGSRDLHEFKRLHMNAEVSADAVWPPIMELLPLDRFARPSSEKR